MQRDHNGMFVCTLPDPANPMVLCQKQYAHKKGLKFHHTTFHVQKKYNYRINFLQSKEKVKKDIEEAFPDKGKHFISNWDVKTTEEK